MPRWEYTIILVADPTVDDLEDRINALGHDGWEFVMSFNGDRNFLFKRQGRPSSEGSP